MTSWRLPALLPRPWRLKMVGFNVCGSITAPGTTWIARRAQQHLQSSFKTILVILDGNDRLEQWLDGDQVPFRAGKAFGGLLKIREKARLAFEWERARDRFSKLANAATRPPVKVATGQLVMLWRQKMNDWAHWWFLDWTSSCCTG